MLLTVGPVVSGVARNIPGSTLGEIRHLAEGEQDMEKGRVDLVCRECLAHQRLGGF